MLKYLKVSDNEEYNILYNQFLQANLREDWGTAKKMAMIISDYNQKDPEFRRLLETLGIE